MITKLSIANFKSVKQLDIDCKKINLFIGEPNTGKSNILEALGLLSWCGHPVDEPLNDYVRFQAMPNLFYDQLLDQEIVVKALTCEKSSQELYIAVKSDGSEFLFHQEGNPFRYLNYRGRPAKSSSLTYTNMPIKFFRFKNLSKYDDTEPGSLKPPNGANLLSVVSGAETLREMMKEFFQEYGLKLVAKQYEGTFELLKEVNGWASTIPYDLASDTLRRVVFYTIAMASNKDSVLVFEEPESNAFPYYTKYLGERIALDQTNQFFIATHNPYLLSAVLEKARKDEIQVFVTYLRSYQTKIRPLTPDQVAELMEADPFLNLDLFVEEGK